MKLLWDRYGTTTPPPGLTLPAPQLVEMDCNIGVKGEGFEYIFGRGKGLVSIRYNGVQLLDDTVRPNFWRAPTNNRRGLRRTLRVCLLENCRTVCPVR